jgi:hypothetical protein
MRQSRKLQPASEPIGIVIADGGTPATETRFSAFVWGPVPDADEALASDGVLVAAAV